MYPDLLLIGSLGFFIFLAIEMIIILACLEYENHIGSFASVLIFLGILCYAGNGHAILSAVIENPLLIVLAIISYVILGVLVAIGKWWLHVHDTLERRRERKAKFFESDLPSILASLERDAKYPRGADQQIINQSIEDVKHDLSAKVMNHEYVLLKWAEVETPSIAKPDVAKNKQRIIGWIAYWPPVLIWSLLNDPIRRLANYSYRMVKGFMGSIADSVWAGEV